MLSLPPLDYLPSTHKFLVPNMTKAVEDSSEYVNKFTNKYANWITKRQETSVLWVSNCTSRTATGIQRKVPLVSAVPLSSCSDVFSLSSCSSVCSWFHQLVTVFYYVSAYGCFWWLHCPCMVGALVSAGPPVVLVSAGPLVAVVSTGPLVALPGVCRAQWSSGFCSTWG